MKIYKEKHHGLRLMKMYKKMFSLWISDSYPSVTSRKYFCGVKPYTRGSCIIVYNLYFVRAEVITFDSELAYINIFETGVPYKSTHNSKRLIYNAYKLAYQTGQKFGSDYEIS